ncbi:cytochrome p450 [Aureococcus anophagefferens]|nr:cytochrome p450 [Aureococcus anophagefferens]
MGRGKQTPAPPSLQTTTKSLCGSLRRAAARRGGEAVAVAAVVAAIAATHDVGACATTFSGSRVYAWPSAPFPTTLPLLGNAVVAAPAFMRFLLREAKKRDGLFLFWPGGVRPMCVVANPAAAKAVLGSSRAFPKGEDYRDKFGLVFGDGLYFAKPRLEAHAPSIAAIFDSTADELWDARLADGPCDIDVQEFFHIATLRAFCSAMIGEDILTWKLEGYEARGAVAKYVAKEVSFGSNVVGEHMLYNIPMSKKAFPRVRRLAASCAAVRRQVFMPLIERRRAMVRAGAAPDDCLTALVASDGDEAFSDDDLLDQLVTLVGAGHDTSAYFCCYGALMLAKHPDVQARLRAELSEERATGRTLS